MRKSVAVAAIAAGGDIIYRYITLTGEGADFGRNVIKTGGFLVILAALSFIEALGTIVDIVSYLYAVVFVLNDGYEIVQGLGKI